MTLHLTKRRPVPGHALAIISAQLRTTVADAGVATASVHVQPYDAEGRALSVVGTFENGLTGDWKAFQHQDPIDAAEADLVISAQGGSGVGIDIDAVSFRVVAP
jgi:hypothetical protein